MLSFESDYIEGAHPAILEALVKTNMEQLSGYGHDKYCELAKHNIAAACGKPNAKVQLLVGGTQTNQIIIDTMLRPWEGVVSAQTGHVATHEAGAIEYTGHKVLCIPEHEGKMDALELDRFMKDFNADGNREHEVFPGLVYISFPTEYGTIYSKKELENIYSVCRTYSIPLFIDGARLGYGLMSSQSDLSLKELAALCDVFYIGGTKVGALCGEAVVFTENNSYADMPPHFENQVKKHGALLAKGRVLGVQFSTLFTDGLYFEISRHAIDMAELLKAGLAEKKYRFFLESPTNQQFIIMENEALAELRKKVTVSFWQKYDETHTVIRLATSWATTKEHLDELLSLL